jgi:hypothetical protein
VRRANRGTRGAAHLSYPTLRSEALQKQNVRVAKNLPLNLHITSREVWLLGLRSLESAKDRQLQTEMRVMKTFLILTALAVMAASSIGCSLFNRGQSCNSCGPGGSDVYMGAPAATAPVIDGGGTYIPGPVR